MNLKKIVSLLLTIVMITALSIVTFANPLEGAYELTGVASKATGLVAGDQFTYSIYVSETGAEELTIDVESCEWNITLNYDKDAFSLVGVPTLNYGFSLQSNFCTAGEGYYAANITNTNAQATFTSETAFITYTFEVLEGATDGEKTFSATGVNFTDVSDFGAIADDNGNVTKNMPTVKVGAAGPTYPYVDTEEVFTDGTYAGITTTAATKAVSVFGKAPEGGLKAGKYGAKVVSGEKTYKFAGIKDVEAGKVWVVKIISPDGTFTFSDETTVMATNAVSAYVD